MVGREAGPQGLKPGRQTGAFTEGGENRKLVWGNRAASRTGTGRSMSGANGDSNGTVRIGIRRRSRGAQNHESEYRECMGLALSLLARRAWPLPVPDREQ